jgi:hypothetical protein
VAASGGGSTRRSRRRDPTLYYYPCPLTLPVSKLSIEHNETPLSAGRHRGVAFHAQSKSRRRKKKIESRVQRAVTRECLFSHKRPSDNHFCDFRFRFHEAPYVEVRPASRLDEPRRPGCVTCRRLRPGRTLRAPARFRVRVGFVLGRGQGRGQGRGRGRGQGLGLGQGRGRGLALLEDPSTTSHTTD